MIFKYYNEIALKQKQYDSINDVANGFRCAYFGNLHVDFSTRRYKLEFNGGFMRDL